MQICNISYMTDRRLRLITIARVVHFGLSVCMFVCVSVPRRYSKAISPIDSIVYTIMSISVAQSSSKLDDPESGTT